jgi:hypothetical protein
LKIGEEDRLPLLYHCADAQVTLSHMSPHSLSF